MKIYNLKFFKLGWIIGNFDQSIFKTEYFEIAIKYYNKNDYDKRHTHKVATEYTIIISGKAKMNDKIFRKNDIIVIEPGECTDFKALKENTITVVIKIPSIIGDKYN